jgi:hypothetical protein
MIRDMYQIGAVSEEEMREFEENGLVEEPEETTEELTAVVS